MSDVLAITGVSDRMLSYVLDPLACGAATVCVSWAAGLARLGKRVHKPHMASDDRGYRLCYYLSIGAVIPRPGNATAGLLKRIMDKASSLVVCPFGLGEETLGAMGLAGVEPSDATGLYLDPSQPLGIRAERTPKAKFLDEKLGQMPDSALIFGMVLPEDLNIGCGSVVRDGLTIGPYCVGLVTRPFTLVAVGLRDCRPLTSPECGWAEGVQETLRPVFTPVPGTARGKHGALLSRVSPTCLAVLSSPVFEPENPAIEVIVSWTPARGLRVVRCNHDPALAPLKGWVIPPLDADSTAHPVAVMM